MKEFKLSPGLGLEIASLQSTGTNINDSYHVVSSDGVDTLKAAREYIDTCGAIKELMDDYIALVEKDVSDMNAMMLIAKQRDSKLARLFK